MQIIRDDNELIQAIQKGGTSLDKAVNWLLQQDKWREAVSIQLRQFQMDQDLKNEVFYEILSAFTMNILEGKFKGQSTLKTYFEAICRNNLKTKLTKKTSLASRFVSTDTDEIIQKENVDQIALQEIDRQSAIQELLKELINKLNEKCQQVLGHIILGYSMQEIADKMTMQRQSIKNDAKKCREKLRTMGEKNERLMSQIKSLIG